MRRRDFLKRTGASAVGAAMASPAMASANNAAVDRPNIVFIMTDQQSAHMMSCAQGNRFLSTPNMDSLAEEGLRFDCAYTANPLCKPCRSSLFTGMYPHQTGVQTNASGANNMESFDCMGRVFHEAGYDTGYFGKWHIAVSSKNTDWHGFQEMEERSQIYSAEAVSEFIARDRDRPFLAVASFMNPHNICEAARFQELPGGGVGEIPPVNERPPLPKNFDPPVNETDINALMRRSYQNTPMFPVGEYTDEQWRRLAWIYCRLTEKVDRLVGDVLAAVRDSGHDNDTLVVFTSDHGDCCGSHHWNQKTVLYDESAKIPLIMRLPGQVRHGVSECLVNTGIDLLPTFCDFAGIDAPSDLPGASLKSTAEDANAPCPDRSSIVVQNCMVQGAEVDGAKPEPSGRMVRSDRYKYCLYDMGEHRESLVDMKADPGEMINRASDPAMTETLADHRRMLRESAVEHEDALALSMLEAI